MDKLISLRSAIKDMNNETALELINELGHDTLYGGGTPLNYAVLYGNKEVFDHLVERGADITATYTGGISNLMAAAERGDEYMVKELLLKGAKTEETDANGNNALDKAVMHAGSNYELITLLLDHGADPFKTDEYGESPIGFAKECIGDTAH